MTLIFLNEENDTFLLGITVVPREIEDNAYFKVEGAGWANRVYHGKCANGEFPCTVSIKDYRLACITSIVIV